MRHTYYTCDRCGRSSLSTAGIITLTAESYTQDEIDHKSDLYNMSEDEMTVHLCPICWGKVKRMIESKHVADDDPRPDHGIIVDDDPDMTVSQITPDDVDKILSGEVKRQRETPEDKKADIEVPTVLSDHIDQLLAGCPSIEPDGKPRKRRGRKSKAEKEAEEAAKRAADEARAAEQAKRDAGVDTEGKTLSEHCDETLARENDNTTELTDEDRRTAWALHDAHWSDAKIAAEIGKGLSKIQACFTEPRPPKIDDDEMDAHVQGKRITDDETSRILNLFAQDVPLKEIAQRTGRPVKTIRNVINRDARELMRR